MLKSRPFTAGLKIAERSTDWQSAVLADGHPLK